MMRHVAKVSPVHDIDGIAGQTTIAHQPCFQNRGLSRITALVFCLIVFALAGCERAGEPANKLERQAERKDQPGVSPPLAMWSAEFRDRTLKECIQSATAQADSKGAGKCQCVVEKASTTIPEQRFKTIHTDQGVKDLIRQIGMAC